MAKQTENNVGIYLRLSQEDMREGDSLSIDNQKLILTKFVQDKGWKLDDEYIDDGYTGTDFSRPGVQRLLSDAQTGKINTIVVKDLSRFGRNYIEVGRYIDYIFPMANIRFIAINDNVDTADRNSAALDMMPIVNLFNEWHSASTSKKIKAVFEAGAKSGKYLGARVPYGYLKGDDPNHLPVVNPETAPVVKRIFQMRLNGMSQRKIADQLNAEKIACPSDQYCANQGRENQMRCRHLWSKTTVERILKNPMYLGHLVQLKTTTISHKNHKSIPKDESEWVVVENTHEPLITQEIWDRCRELDGKKIGKARKKGTVLPLSAMLFCADCGFSMKYSSVSWMSGKSKDAPRKTTEGFYKCSTYSRFGKEYCSTHYIRKKDIEPIVLSDIQSMMEMVLTDEAEARRSFLSRKQKNSSQQVNADKDKLKAKKARIAELDRLMQSVYEDKLNGAIEPEICSKLLSQYSSEQKALTAETEQIESRLMAQRQDESDVERFIERLKQYEGAEVLTRAMCLELIDHITVDAYCKNKNDRDICIYYKLLDKGYSEQSDT